jgi:hypothetical protein
MNEEEIISRSYQRIPRKNSGVIVLKAEDFEKGVNNGLYTKWDGHGYWAKDGKESEDLVFSEPRLDATQVMWYNK